MAAIASSSVPLRVNALAVYMTEMERRDSLRAYEGDMLHALVRAVYGMSGQDLKIPSYSDMVEKVYDMRPVRKSRMSNAETIAAAEDGIFQFLAKE